MSLLPPSGQVADRMGVADARAHLKAPTAARETISDRENVRSLRLENLLWVVGLIGLLLCSLTAGRILVARRLADRFESTDNLKTQLPSSAEPALSGRGSYGSAATVAEDAIPAVVGRLEIPAIGMITPLLDGDDSMSLTEGAGHIPGTAYPGGLGTVGIAGHRDTHFRLLKNVLRGMDVRLVDHTGTYHYRVTSSEIVTPEQVSVLDIVSEPGLALITCYPFHYVGSAPKRFVVHARLISVAPDEVTPAAR